MEQNTLKKALYVFLTSLLGILLFVTIQRSLGLIALLLLNLDYAQYNFGTTPLQIHSLNIATMLLAVFFGGWYGVWLGLHWYDLVYRHGRTGWLHGLTGGLFHAEADTAPIVKRSAAPSEQSVPVRSVKVSRISAVAPATRWEFDDLVKTSTAAVKPKPKRSARRIVKKAVVAETQEALQEGEPAPKKVRKTRARAVKVVAESNEPENS